MSTLARELQTDHDELRDGLERIRAAARWVRAVPASGRGTVIDPVLAYLRGELVPHDRREERTLYPQVGARLGSPEATQPMQYDHAAIREWTARLAETPLDDTDALEERLYGLYALIRTHFWKEEKLYLPLLRSGSLTRSSCDPPPPGGAA